MIRKEVYPSAATIETKLKYKPNITETVFLWAPKTLSKHKNWFSVDTIPLTHSPNVLFAKDRKQLFFIPQDFGTNIDRQYIDAGTKEPSELLAAHGFNSSSFDPSFYDTFFGIQSMLGTRLATFKNVLTNHFGMILDHTNHKRQILNGGCISGVHDGCMMSICFVHDF